MKKYAVIVAAGSGLRMATDLPKQFLLLQDKPVLWHTMEAFLGAYNDLKIILVVPAAHENTAASVVEKLSDPTRVQITSGGNTRYQSVKNGLQLVEKDSIVFVHDGVRCLVTAALIDRCYTVAVEKGNAVPVIRSVDSLRIENADGTNAIIDRNKIRIIQTPQTFHAEELLAAFDKAGDASFTDEASVAESAGMQINLVEGDSTNIKITQAIDLLVAGNILATRSLPG